MVTERNGRRKALAVSAPRKPRRLVPLTPRIIIRLAKVPSRKCVKMGADFNTPAYLTPLCNRGRAVRLPKCRMLKAMRHFGASHFFSHAVSLSLGKLADNLLTCLSTTKIRSRPFNDKDVGKQPPARAPFRKSGAPSRDVRFETAWNLNTIFSGLVTILAPSPSIKASL